VEHHGHSENDDITAMIETEFNALAEGTLAAIVRAEFWLSSISRFWEVATSQLPKIGRPI